MTINYTTLLGLAKPVTGTESGQWGDVVNDQITTLVEDAVANASSISVTAGNVTLTTTTGSANQARMSTLIITGTPGTTRNVIAPSQAKIYVVVNQSDSAVVIKGAATTGITIASGQTAQIVWNGSDFVEVGSYVHGNFVVNGNLSVNGNSTLGNDGADTTTINGQFVGANANISKATTLSTSAPAFFWLEGATYTDTGTAGGTTQPHATFHQIDAPTVNTSNIVTYTNASTLYIAGAPSAAGSATITNPYALFINGGASYFGAAVTMSATTQNIALGTSQTSGTFTVGGAAQTGTQTFDQSTKTHTLNIGAGATESAATKTINIGTGGVATSTTAVNIGSTNGTTITLNGTVNATTVNVTTLDLTNLEVTNIKAKDGTAAMSIADSTGVVTVVKDQVVNGITVGRGAGAVSTNTAVGASALAANTTGVANTVVGSEAGLSNTSANELTAFGRLAARNNTTGNYNTAVGSQAGHSTTTGANNTSIGQAALYSNTTASHNTAVGYQAGYSGTTVSNATAVGFQALFTGSYASTAVGYQAGYANNSNFNTYLGYLAGQSDVSAGAAFNVFVGAEAGRYYGAAANNNNTAVGGGAMQGSTTVANNTGTANVAFGASTLVSLTSGSNNIAVGAAALYSNTTASNNTAIGYQAGYSNTTGTDNISIGRLAGYGTTTTSNNIAIGFNTLSQGAGSASNVVIGHEAQRYVGSGVVAVGHQTLTSSTASNNTAVGYQAGYANTTGTGNTFLGNQAGLAVTTSNGQTFIGSGAGSSKTTGGNNTFVGASAGGSATTGTGNTFVGVNDSTNGAGYAVTTGSKNTILGGYTGNQGGLDIRTASNYIVLSDGDGNPRGIFDGSGNLLVNRTAVLTNSLVSVDGSLGLNGASGSGVLRLYNGGTQYCGFASAAWAFGGSYSASDAAVLAANNFIIGANGSERARITSGGELLVKATSISATSDVGFKLNPGGGGEQFAIVIDTSTAAQTPITVYNINATNNGYRFYVRADGGVANYQANDINLSDQRTKKDIVAAPSYWDKIKGIEIVHFKYKDQTHDDNNVGVIAQQVEQVAPEFVDQDGWGETPEDGVPLKSIYTSDMYHAAIKALQEAMARIEKLEAEVAALKGV